MSNALYSGLLSLLVHGVEHMHGPALSYTVALKSARSPQLRSEASADDIV